jgi:hypothetical protein
MCYVSSVLASSITIPFFCKLGLVSKFFLKCHSLVLKRIYYLISNEIIPSILMSEQIIENKNSNKKFFFSNMILFKIL